MTGSRPPESGDSAPNAVAPAETGADPDAWPGRWSRRKRQVEAERRPDAPEPADDRPVAAASAVTPEDSAAPSTDDAPAEEVALPPIESLDADSDYRAFMTGQVSDELRLAALRKLFRLPQFNVTDGLDDYDDDFTSFRALGRTRTHDMLREYAREAASVVQEKIGQKQEQEQEQESPAVDFAAPATVTETATVEAASCEPAAAGQPDEQPALAATAVRRKPPGRS